jgi:hypothetical protein
MSMSTVLKWHSCMGIPNEVAKVVDKQEVVVVAKKLHVCTGLKVQFYVVVSSSSEGVMCVLCALGQFVHSS